MKVRDEIVATGKRNHEAYLASDHMDVYVATSMRERHEYQIVNKVINEVFANSGLAKLKLLCFDPTQAYCTDRIDKGLAEGLMLKRANARCIWRKKPILLERTRNWPAPSRRSGRSLYSDGTGWRRGTIC